MAVSTELIKEQQRNVTIGNTVEGAGILMTLGVALQRMGIIKWFAETGIPFLGLSTLVGGVIGLVTSLIGGFLSRRATRNIAEINTQAAVLNAPAAH